MDSSTLKIFLAMAGYMLIVIGIGLFYAKRSNKSTEDYFIGGRSLGPWVAAMSAEASDMSGWLLMGLPGVAYWCGIADAAWTAIGLAVGTYINWLIVAKRLRKYSTVAGNAITIPEFFSNRYHEKKNIIMTLSAVFILIFFTVYASSCFVTCGKLFSTLFGYSYHSMLIVGAVFVVVYTFLGGFLAESASDFMQAVVMIFALVAILVTGTINAGGISAVIENAKAIPGYLSLTSIATPITDAAGVQQVVNGVPQFGEASKYGLLTILSTLSWGLGYFGVPQVLLRFMAIRKVDELKKSRRIATVWVVISLFAAVAIGVIGRTIFPAEANLLTSGGAESIFINLSEHLLPAILAGVVMAGILAATISSSDSYLLIASSAFAKNIYEKSSSVAKVHDKIFHKSMDDKSVMLVSRMALILISLLGVVIAWDEDSVIFDIVSFAWSGFGATFGPIMLFSLFWKRTTYPGAIAGMVSGAATVFIWKLALKPLGGVFAIYELLPAFLVSCLFIVVVSLLTKKPSQEICDEFDKAKAFED
ncbi:MAG: sodium/proline symporter [Oscillospiraceae bacterium]|nr:sodium/proline symporter [Oscillospiraceae bacterium]MDD6146562.1 sodium/proline symporter [Oscillospiraceae bacterium]